MILNEKYTRPRLMGQRRIRVGTFNVNGKSPAQDLSTWLGNEPPSSHVNNNEGQGEASTPEADMLIMGFQEVEHSTEAFFNFAGRAREESWTEAILAALGDKAERYEKVSFLMVIVITCS
jgi:inositol polyphosphate 5-phosphatase INPP5B/F